eukprot:1896681-Pleurochrysis_carterae.AAC.1
MIGEESWAIKKSERKKSESRRFVLVNINGLACYVPFEKVRGLTASDEPADPATESLAVCMQKCVDAALARKPGTVHQAVQTAGYKSNQAASIAAQTPAINLESNSCELKTRQGARRQQSGDSDDTCIAGSGAADMAERLHEQKKYKGPASGIPLGLAFIGDAKLQSYSLEKVRLSLTEN